MINKIKSLIGFLKVNFMYKGVKTNGYVKVSGIPILILKNGGEIIFGKNVTLKSNNTSYHLNMHSPVKIMVDRKSALIEIGDNTRINGSCIHAFQKITIGRNCLIAANCQIFDSNGHDLSFPDVTNRINSRGGAREIIIEDNVWIGANCIILPGVRIGYGSVIAAGSVVIKEIPPMCVAGGNPAEVVKYYNNND